MDTLALALEKKEKLNFEDFKYSFFILKPNAAKNYEAAIQEIEENKFIIVNQYAIMDYDTVTMALHIDQPEAMKYIKPISRFNYDFYGNYAVLVVVKKKDITYENFCNQVLRLKQHLRDKFALSYIAYAFDISELGDKNEKQKLIIKAVNGDEIKKDSMNGEGTFMVVFINSIHSPDDTVEKTIKELTMLKNMALLETENIIPKTILNSIRRYKTFEFLKDM